MRCPFCKEDHDRVIDSRSANAGATVRRRRECIACEKRFTTYEKVEEITLYVIKKDSRRELFDREKIKRGIVTACAKRSVSLETVEDIVNRIELELYGKYDREVRSTKIGDLVIRELKALDHVAYVRFASVYRDFKDVREFMHEVTPMLKTGPRGRARTKR
jgi:transcriptional repressor NrdR